MRILGLIRFLVFAALFNFVVSLGINCRGSVHCTKKFHVARSLTNSIRGIDRNRWYRNGQPIACVSVRRRSVRWYCAFLQNTGGAWGGQIQALSLYIEGHGCQECGSVPLSYPAVNDVSRGELTYNYVRKPCRLSSSGGLCPMTSSADRLIEFSLFYLIPVLCTAWFTFLWV